MLASKHAVFSGSNCRAHGAAQAPCVAALRPAPRHVTSRVRRGRTVCIAAAASALQEAALVPVMERGELSQFPAAAGVYAVYDSSNTLQYIGLSRKIAVSVANHMQQVPELVAGVKFTIVEDASREALTDAWKLWVEQAAESTGSIPPGNLPGESRFQSRAGKPAKPEIRLTAGKPITGITIDGLLDQVVKGNRVVAFIKGTRTQPQCGFSHKMLTLLNEARADFEVVNVLDEVHNPGLREAIKTYSQWPTIPQLYVKGEFVGGADITEQMSQSGELQQLLASK